jgi:hypothetical protein
LGIAQRKRTKLVKMIETVQTGIDKNSYVETSMDKWGFKSFKSFNKF